MRFENGDEGQELQPPSLFVGGGSRLESRNQEKALSKIQISEGIQTCSWGNEPVIEPAMTSAAGGRFDES